MKNHWLSNKDKTQPDLNMGDLVIKDSGDLGLDVYSKDDGRKVCFFNAAGCEALKKWLDEKGC